jgi:hypothetical protein
MNMKKGPEGAIYVVVTKLMEAGMRQREYSTFRALEMLGKFPNSLTLRETLIKYERYVFNGLPE